MELSELWQHMGLFAKAIALTLILMSIISLTTAAAKWFRFRKMAAATRAFAPQFSQALEQDNITEALDLTERYKNSHVARVLGESLREVAPLLNDRNLAGAAISSAERSVEREQILLSNDLKNGMTIMATIASTSPFVGLLGTTWGVMTAFTGMAEGGGGLEAISAGIAEALITTAVGLMVAISAVWLYNYFTRKLDTLFSELAYAGREMIDWMMEREIRMTTGGRPARAASAVAGD